MKDQTTEALAKARIRRWHDIASGCLVVEPTKIVVYRRKFMRHMEQVAALETRLLTRVDSDATAKNVSVTLETAEGEPTCEVFSLCNGGEVQPVSSVLSDLLKAAEDERRRREEEAARRERDAEQRRQQVRQEFAADLWNTAEVMWSLVRAAYSMESALILGDWTEARKQYSTLWQHADKLKGDHDIDLTGPLKDLDEDFHVENGEGAIARTGPLIKALAEKVLRSDTQWAKWRRDEIVPSAMSPNWDQLPYFLLFTAGHFETILSSRIEDWDGVGKSLLVLRSSGAVLRECFKIELDGLLDAAESAGRARNPELIVETAGQIGSVFESCFKTRPFEYKEVEQQPDGQHDCTLPPSA